METEPISLDIYLESTKTIEKYFMKQESLQDILNLFSFWDKDIFSYIKLYRETSEEIVSPLLATNTHSLYLSALKLTISGQSSSVYPILRVSCENAVYALMIHNNIELAEIWTNRHKDEESYKKNITAFSPAIKKLRKRLEEYDEKSNDTKYAEHILGLYDAVIDFGSHPNPKTIQNNSEIYLKNHNLVQRFEYLSNFTSEMTRTISACLDYGIAISVILSLKDINNENFSLDKKFLKLFKQINNSIDSLIGESLEVKDKYYQKYNKSKERNE